MQCLLVTRQMAVFREGRRTEGTFVGSLSCMGAVVVLQLAARNKRFWAAIALVFPNIIVSIQMIG